jgi:hypothetical protein
MRHGCSDVVLVTHLQGTVDQPYDEKSSSTETTVLVAHCLTWYDRVRTSGCPARPHGGSSPPSSSLSS